MKENKENVEMLINPTEFQELILNYIGSDEFNKIFQTFRLGDLTGKSKILQIIRFESEQFIDLLFHEYNHTLPLLHLHIPAHMY